MGKSDRDIVIKKIVEMPVEQVQKVLIFMAGMEAEGTTRKEKAEQYPEKQKSKT